MKKKLLSYAMSLAMLLAASVGIAIPASAAEPATLTVSDVTVAKSEETVTVDVSLQGSVAGVQIELQHDSDILELTEIKTGPQCPNGYVQTSAQTGRFVYAAATESNVDGVIAQYTYKVNPDAAVNTKTELEVVEAIMVPENVNDTFHATIASHGSVTIGPEAEQPEEPEEPGTGEPEEPGTGETENPGTGETENPGEGKPGTGEKDDQGKVEDTGKSDGVKDNNGSDNGGKKSPTTGDTNAEMLWISVLLIGSALGSAAIVKKQRG